MFLRNVCCLSADYTFYIPEDSTLYMWVLIEFTRSRIRASGGFFWDTILNLRVPVNQPKRFSPPMEP
jgi:hypothetical protein